MTTQSAQNTVFAVSFAAALVCTGAHLSGAQNFDADLSRAQSTGALVQIADRYAAAGHQQQAKAVVDRAALRARTEADWQAVAGAYQQLGYLKNAAAAERKAREVTE